MVDEPSFTAPIAFHRSGDALAQIAALYEAAVAHLRGALNRSVDRDNDRPFHETSFTLAGGTERIVVRPDLIVAVTGEIIRRADGSEADHSADELEPQAA